MLWASPCLANLFPGADSLFEIVGLSALPSLSCQQGMTGPLPQFQFPSFTAPQTLGNWQQELGRAILMEEPHTALGVSCPSLQLQV